MADKFDRWNHWAPRYIADLCHDFGLKPFQAAAIPGNFAAESSHFNDIIEDGALSKGWAGGTGHAQWTGVRRKRFEQWLRRRGWNGKADGAFGPNTYEGNYSYLFRELSGAEPGLDYRRVVKMLRSAQTIDEAAYVVGKYYEGPAVLNLGPRQKGAREALALYERDHVEPTAWKETITMPPPVASTSAPIAPDTTTARRAIPFFKSVVTMGAGTALPASLLAILQAYQPGVPLSNQLPTLWPLIVAAAGSGSALISRVGSDAQPLTMSQGKADQISAARAASDGGENLAPLPPEAWATAGAVPVRPPPTPAPLEEMSLQQFAHELPRALALFGTIIPALGAVSKIVEAVDLERRAEPDGRV